MTNTKSAVARRVEVAVYFAGREVARRLAWLLLIAATLAVLGGRGTPGRSFAIGSRGGAVTGGALAGMGKGASIRMLVGDAAQAANPRQQHLSLSPRTSLE